MERAIALCRPSTYNPYVRDSKPAGPFACILVPYDGSEPAQAALRLALSIVPATGKLVIINAVDEALAIGQSATTVMAYDPTPIFEALDTQGQAILADARARSSEAEITPETDIVHDRPINAILGAIEKHRADLVVMGTHARAGVAELFLGSTTEAVLRSTDTPVLTVRSADAAEAQPFTTALLGIDDSDASDAAVMLTATLARAYETQIVACNAIDTSRLYASTSTNPFETQELLREMRSGSEATLAQSLQRASLDGPSVASISVEGAAADVLLESAQEHHATVIVVGSHGRRGLRRLFLGSVAEEVVRRSPVPVLVIRRSVS